MSDKRCDAGLPNGKRCKNDATQWVHATFRPNENTVEDWPMAVCDIHAEPTGLFHRMGPDRRRQYVEYKQHEGATE